MTDNNNCMAMRCRCCECQGKRCLVAHPGHSHRSPATDTLAQLAEILRQNDRRRPVRRESDEDEQC